MALTKSMHYSEDKKSNWSLWWNRQILLAKPKPSGSQISASQSYRKPLVEPRRAKPKTNLQTPTHL